MTLTATMESTVAPSVRRPATDPLARARRESIASAFPWLLFFAVWLLLFPTQNRMDAAEHPADEQSSAEIAHAVQEGSILTRILIISLGTTGVVLLILNRARLRLNGVIFTILLLFLGWSALSTFWADDPSLTARRLISLAFMILFAAGCAARMNVDTLTLFIAGIPALNLIPGVIAEVEYGRFQPFRNGHRFAGTAPHPNVQAASLSVAAILLCWVVWRAKGFRRLRFAAAVLLLSAFLLMTGSRTSILAVLAALAFSSVLIVARDHKRLLPLLGAAIFLLLGLGALFKLAVSGSGTDPFVQAIQRQGDENDASTLNGRLDLWRECLKFAAKRPLLGYGYGGFWSAKRIEAISGDQTWPIQQSHSAYIEELLALGITGLALYVALLFGCLWICVAQFFHHRDAYGAWAAVLVFIAIHNLTEAINVTPLFTNLAFNLMVLSLALISSNGRSANHADRLLQTA
jgi:exopolysaccharide production protein ExoQ